MKRLPKAIILTGTIISVLSAASVTAFAASSGKVSVKSSSSRSFPFFIIAIVAVAVLGVIKKKRGGGSSGFSDFFKNNSNDFFSSNNSFGSGLNGGNDFFDDRLNQDENLMVQMYQAEIKKKKPDPVSTKCPNCGAPLRISDKTHCPYCRSEILNNNVERFQDPKHDPIPPEEYNPHRYYDENLTGYESGYSRDPFKSGFSDGGFNGNSSGSYNNGGFNSGYGSSSDSYNNNGGFGGYNNDDRR